ncbi:citrate lyase subunit beta/citryl-CoA lyase [Inquilinus ginsengisoli]|uniref:Citrate lyase subunit beta/citryl-CoA lyase n=1 Tax=Inquilinus ginsengisoli TaxID=363840 RepID=A0ABU1JXL2_9PROT|nr:CoA ester lyase [Inquilinus ginsengisoli]MDR6293364.1 citrate lyase subunit beta/citryl-CoA lyase [Inquilinus ginsengisoli]
MTETRFRRLRSLLYVPADRERFVAGAAARGADAVILDLEDGVAESAKPAARAALAAAVPLVGAAGARVLVRINSRLAHAAEDIAAAVRAGADGLLVPKTEDGQWLRLIADRLDELEREAGRPEGWTRLIPLVETLRGLDRRAEIAAATPRTLALVCGTEDLSAEIGAEPDSAVLRLAQQQVLLAARGAGLLPLGLMGSLAGIDDLDALRRAAEEAVRQGFEGASCIHPAQVAVLNQAFTPDAAAVDRARRIVAALLQGQGTAKVDGRMVDAPVVARARRVLARAGVAETERD